MIDIPKITDIKGSKHIAIMDTSSISFMQGLDCKGINADIILQHYDLVLIPEWVFTEVKDSAIRINYLKKLLELGYPIFRIEECNYVDLIDGEEGALYQMVLASAAQLARIRSYLRRFVEKTDPLDIVPYKEWINDLYTQWPIPGDVLISGRTKKKNAGEVSITILAEVVSWYYPDTETLTVYSQDRDCYDFQFHAENCLREFFQNKIPAKVSFKSNDAILCQLYRAGLMSIDSINDCRKDLRKVTYSKIKDDKSVFLSTEVVDNEIFVELLNDNSVHIIF